MNTNQAPDSFPAEDFRATATAFSQLAGVLGGFCFTILVLVLSPDFLQNNIAVKDWVLALLLLSAISYVLGSSLLANSMNAPLIKSLDLRLKTFHVGILLSNVGHVLLASTLTILVYQFSATVGVIAAVLIVILAVANGISFLGMEFRSLRK